jgi:hypothetical protein
LEEPFNLALVVVRLVALLVDAVGAVAGVVNDSRVPKEVPYVLLAMAQ